MGVNVSTRATGLDAFTPPQPSPSRGGGRSAGDIGAVARLFKSSAALLRAPANRRADMSELGPRLRTRRDGRCDPRHDAALCRRPDRAARREDRRGGLVPDRSVAGNGRARAARDHGLGGGWRARARLSRACRRAGGGGAGLGLDRAQLRRAFEPLRQPDQALGEPGAEGEISAEIDLRRACRLARHVGGRGGLGRRLDEAEGRDGAGRLRPQRHQILDHQRGLCRHARRLRQDRRRDRAASPPS